MCRRLPPEVYREEIARQLQNEEFTLHLGVEIISLEELRTQNFEAVYLATGWGGEDFAALRSDGKHCRMEGELAVFAGGEAAGRELVEALAQGLAMAWAIEVFLKTGKLEFPTDFVSCKAVADKRMLIPTAKIIRQTQAFFRRASDGGSRAVYSLSM